jgi:hypothetical protein
MRIVGDGALVMVARMGRKMTTAVTALPVGTIDDIVGLSVE